MPSLLGFDIGLIRYLAGEKDKGGMGGLALCDDPGLLQRCRGLGCAWMVSGVGGVVEFRGMGLGNVREFMDEGAVTGGWYDRVLLGWAAKSEYENSDAN